MWTVIWGLWACAPPAQRARVDVYEEPLDRKLDRDQDGVISETELPGGDGPGAKRLRAWFERADADQDGKLSAAERTAARERMFDRLDANRDGFLDASDRPAGDHRL